MLSIIIVYLTSDLDTYPILPYVYRVLGTSENPYDIVCHVSNG